MMRFGSGRSLLSKYTTFLPMSLGLVPGPISNSCSISNPQSDSSIRSSRGRSFREFGGCPQDLFVKIPRISHWYSSLFCVVRSANFTRIATASVSPKEWFYPRQAVNRFVAPFYGFTGIIHRKHLSSSHFPELVRL